jgi:hypothetical protein
MLLISRWKRTHILEPKLAVFFLTKTKKTDVRIYKKTHKKLLYLEFEISVFAMIY